MSLSGLGLSGLSGVAGGYTPALAGATHHWAARLESGYSNGNNLTTISDRVGSLTLTATGTSPTYATGQINGLPAYSFGGAGYLAGGGIGITGSSATTNIIVAQATSGSGDRGLLHYGASAGTGGQVRRCSVDPSYRFNNGNRVFNAPASPNAWHIWVYFNAAAANYQNHRCLVDGTEMTQLSISGGTTVPNLSSQETIVGAGRNAVGDLGTYLVGYIAEVVVIPSYSASNVNYHGSRLASIYGLSWTNFAG